MEEFIIAYRDPATGALRHRIGVYSSLAEARMVAKKATGKPTWFGWEVAAVAALADSLHMTYAITAAMVLAGERSRCEKYTAPMKRSG